MEDVIFLIVIAASLYLAPTIIAMIRGHKNIVAIAVVNIALGWTLVGYVVALVWSLIKADDKERIVINQFSPNPHAYQHSIAQPLHPIQNYPPALPMIDVTPVSMEQSLKSKLEELRDLHESGLISDEEFQDKRKALLN